MNYLPVGPWNHKLRNKKNEEGGSAVSTRKRMVWNVPVRSMEGLRMSVLCILSENCGFAHHKGSYLVVISSDETARTITVELR